MIVRMTTKHSEDVVPLSDGQSGLRSQAGGEGASAGAVASRGGGVAVVQSVVDHGAAENERSFMRAMMAELSYLKVGREVPLAKVKAKFGLGSVPNASIRFAASAAHDAQRRQDPRPRR